MVEIRLVVDGETVVQMVEDALIVLALYGRKDRVASRDHWVDAMDDPEAPIMLQVRVPVGVPPRDLFDPERRTKD